MEDGARYNESLARVKFDRFVFQIDQEPALDHVEELVLFVVLVPVVFTLDDANADDGAVDLAERLIEPFVLAARAIALMSISSSEPCKMLRRVS